MTKLGAEGAEVPAAVDLGGVMLSVFVFLAFPLSLLNNLEILPRGIDRSRSEYSTFALLSRLAHGVMDDSGIRRE
jgi:hypothetical protein